MRDIPAVRAQPASSCRRFLPGRLRRRRLPTHATVQQHLGKIWRLHSGSDRKGFGTGPGADRERATVVRVTHARYAGEKVKCGAGGEAWGGRWRRCRKTAPSAAHAAGFISQKYRHRNPREGPLRYGKVGCFRLVPAINAPSSNNRGIRCFLQGVLPSGHGRPVVYRETRFGGKA